MGMPLAELVNVLVELAVGVEYFSWEGCEELLVVVEYPHDKCGLAT